MRQSRVDGVVILDADVAELPGLKVSPRSSDEVQRRLRVNPILCTGFGYCAEIVPELISLDDWGFPMVNSKDIEDNDVLHHARRAVATCPQVALILEERARAQRDGDTAARVASTA